MIFIERICFETYRGCGKRPLYHYNSDSIFPRGRYQLSRSHHRSFLIRHMVVTPLVPYGLKYGPLIDKVYIYLFKVCILGILVVGLFYFNQAISISCT